MIRPTFSLALLALLVACGGSQSPDDGAAGIDPRRLYPMQEENVWTYDVDTGVDLPALGISRVTAVEGPRVSVANNDSPPIVYELSDQGVFRVASDTWLLKRPIEVGATWPAAGGREARVTSIDEHVEVEAGTFDGCVKVEEADAVQSVTTIYCPDIGPVVVDTQTRTELSGQTVRVRGELRAYVIASE